MRWHSFELASGLNREHYNQVPRRRIDLSRLEALTLECVYCNSERDAVVGKQYEYRGLYYRSKTIPTLYAALDAASDAVQVDL